MKNTIAVGIGEHFENLLAISSRRRHTRFKCDWSSDVCSSDLIVDATDTRHTTAYSYANVRTSAELIWTLGLSADFISNNVVDENRLNPKLGLTWTPEPMTTLRAAAFRATKRDLVTDQTIEPTQVAGFNQFYDDQNSADIWHYGIGLAPRATAGM